MTTAHFARISSSSGVLLIAAGVMVLLGWTFDVHVLKAVFGPITMKANAAVGLAASGVALLLLRAESPAGRAVGAAFAVSAGAIGAATLSQHLVGWDLGIDQLLFREPPGAAATTSPGRMGPNASTSLTLSAVALLCLYRGRPAATAWAQILGALVLVLALVPTIGYLYGATELYAIATYTGIALHTGLALLVLGAGILAARTDEGPVAALVSERPHGVVGRRLMVVALIAPVALGYLRVLGERRGWFDTGLGVSLVVVAMIVLMSLTIWRNAVALARADADLALAERDRDELFERERAARQAAERADRAKDEFLAALSHELRTPLNAILGWMQMLQQGVLSEDKRADATHAVTRNAGMLARLIEELLDTSRITTGHLELATAPVDLNAVLQAAVESVLPAANAKHVTVVVTTAPAGAILVGDGPRLQQIVWNLLSNAIKFSPEGGRVAAEVAAVDGAVVIRVGDEGDGIDPAFLPYVFERFRSDDSIGRRRAGGLGLGLYIARHLTELHGGTIHAESPGAGRGSVFTVRLPAGGELAGATAGPAAGPRTVPLASRET